HAALLSVTMTLRPRSSTLFPYTTLFRSGLGAALAAHGCRSQLAAGGGAGLRVLVRPARPGGPGDRLGHGGDDRPARRGAAGGQLPGGRGLQARTGPVDAASGEAGADEPAADPRGRPRPAARAHRPGLAGRGAHLLPRPLAEEAAPQAPTGAAGQRGPDQLADRSRWRPAPGDGLGELRRADDGGLPGRAALAEPVRGRTRRLGAAPGVATDHQVRGPGAGRRPGRARPDLRTDLS